MSDTQTFTPEDRTALLDTVERFAREAIAPHVNDWDAAGQFPRTLYTQAAHLGLLGLGYPEHLGGTPAPWRARNAVSQLLARRTASGGLLASLFSHNIGLPPVLAHGSPDALGETRLVLGNRAVQSPLLLVGMEQHPHRDGVGHAAGDGADGDVEQEVA